MLKKLFYASASILMLALAYHLGATSVSAQAGSGALMGGYGNFVCTPNGDIWFSDGRGGWSPSSLGNVFNGSPAGRTIVQFDYSSEGGAMANTGEVFQHAGGGWHSVGVSPAGAPTPAAQPTFGQVKAQYRK